MERPPIFVVNLAGATARWARIAASLGESGLSWFQRFDAVDGRLLAEDVMRKSVDRDFFTGWYGRPPSAGEIGCTLSHLGVYERMLDMQAHFAVVLEDDALPMPDVASLLEEKDLHKWMASDCPRVLLLSAADRFLRRGGFAVGPRHCAHRVRNAWLAHGYLINHAAARLLLVRQRPIRLLVDDWLALDMVFGLQVFCVQPPCVRLHTTSMVSSLDEDRHGLRAVARGQGWEHRMRRFCRRVADAFYYKPFFGIAKGG